MFTGIVQAVGRIEAVTRGPSAARVVVDAAPLAVDDVAIGDSVCVSGCCLTVVARDGARLAFDVSQETLDCTAGLDRAGEVNLEKALRLADRLGGHLTSGHVDGVGRVIAFDAITGGSDAGSRRLVIEAPAALARFIAVKGAIAVHGVSLTVNAVDAARFRANLIPHTLATTTLGRTAVGDALNIEVDLVARYVARLREFDGT